MKTAIILSIGDELVLGQTVDTNSAWLSRQLAGAGCAVLSHTTVADDQKAIEDAIRHAIGRCDYLLISGGLGPTADDLTRQALAAVMNAPLELNEQWLAHMQAYFKERGRVMPDSNKIQAMIPRGAKMIWNHNGTAAGIRGVMRIEPNETEKKKFELREDDPHHVKLLKQFVNARHTVIFAMPGVPKEMKLMFERDVLPHISGDGGAVILSRTLHTFGLGESAIAEKLGDLMMRQKNPSVGTTVSQGIVSLRVNSRFDSRDEAQQQLNQTVGACHEKLGDLIYGEDEQTLQEVVGKMLAASKQSVATAESCTGGLLAKMLTDVSGSSEYFQTGFVTYSNKSKYERLGVSMEIINMHGAVSEPVVSAMAKNARRLAKADFALAISGVAGPTGGSAAKPVGMVCIALDAKDEGGRRKDENGNESAVSSFIPHPSSLVRTFLFPGDREWVRDRSAKMALAMLRYHLLHKSMPF